jgi:hypothetical protein
MREEKRRSQLSTGRTQLLRLCQTVNFGRIEQLQIRSGEPVFDPAPEVITEIKFGAENGPRPELRAPDFVLKAQQVELFQELDRLGTGRIRVLEVKHGLPFRMLVSSVS